MPTLMLMAKAPWSGMAKTRLVPPYSRHQAAEVAEILLRLSVDLCAQHWPGELVIAGKESGHSGEIKAVPRFFQPTGRGTDATR